MTGTILVLGATGNVGGPLVKTLIERGERVRAASRSGRAVAGAEGVVFDYADPATIAPAFAGVDRAFIMLPSGHVNIKELLLPVVAAAAAAKVKIVFQSALGVDADDSIPYRQVELAIERAGVPYVILRPNWFADNFHTFWKAGIDQGVIAVPAAAGKSSFIDARDIAASAAAALTTPAFDGRAFNLTGPQAWSYGEAAELIAQTLAKDVRYLPIDDETFIGILTGAGVPQAYAGFLAALFHPVREGWTAVVTGDVETLTGHEPRSLNAYLQDHRAHLA